MERRGLKCRTAVAVIATLFFAQAATAAVRSTPAARAWRPPSGFIGQAWCIHRHESVDWHRRWVDWRGARSSYAGGMQFLESTWRAAGGIGEPWQWPAREQVYRAYVVWRRDGRSWREWGTAGACGLR